MTSITELPTIKDVFEYIEQKYPNWILCLLDDYSKDYPQLRNNWANICYLMKIEKQKIIVTQDFDNDEKLMFSEILSKVGFIVRNMDEIIACSKCKLAIPCKETYDKMKENGLPVPNKWSVFCENC